MSAATRVKQGFSVDAVCNVDAKYPYHSRSRLVCEEQYGYGLALARRYETVLRVVDGQIQSE